MGFLLAETHVQPSEILDMTAQDLHFWMEVLGDYRKQVQNGQ